MLTHKSNASLHLPMSITSSTPHHHAIPHAQQGDGAHKAARSKRCSKKGKEREQDVALLPWLPADIGRSFLEMDGQPAEEEDVGC
jgi:hypothetical protein